MSFDALGLREDLLRAVREQGYTEPTPIQRQAIPTILTGSDVLAGAQTGTGKTAGFTLPLLQRLLDARTPGGKRQGPRPIRALVLTPTRELAAQVQESVETYGRHLPHRLRDGVRGGRNAPGRGAAMLSRPHPRGRLLARRDVSAGTTVLHQLR